MPPGRGGAAWGGSRRGAPPWKERTRPRRASTPPGKRLGSRPWRGATGGGAPRPALRPQAGWRLGHSPSERLPRRPAALGSLREAQRSQRRGLSNRGRGPKPWRRLPRRSSGGPSAAPPPRGRLPSGGQAARPRGRQAWSRLSRREEPRRTSPSGSPGSARGARRACAPSATPTLWWPGSAAGGAPTSAWRGLSSSLATRCAPWLPRKASARRAGNGARPPSAWCPQCRRRARSSRARGASRCPAWRCPHRRPALGTRRCCRRTPSSAWPRLAP